MNVTTASSHTASILINEMDCFRLSSFLPDIKRNDSSLASINQKKSTNSITNIENSNRKSNLETIDKHKKYLRQVKQNKKYNTSHNDNHSYKKRRYYGKHTKNYVKRSHHHNRTQRYFNFTFFLQIISELVLSK